MSLWDFLEQQLAAQRCRVSAEAAAALPFDFWGGYVGYLGYELKAQCGGSAAHASDLPDAALFCIDRCEHVGPATHRPVLHRQVWRCTASAHHLYISRMCSVAGTWPARQPPPA